MYTQTNHYSKTILEYRIEKYCSTKHIATFTWLFGLPAKAGQSAKLYTQSLLIMSKNDSLQFVCLYRSLQALANRKTDQKKFQLGCLVLTT